MLSWLLRGAASCRARRRAGKSARPSQQAEPLQSLPAKIYSCLGARELEKIAEEKAGAACGEPAVLAGSLATDSRKTPHTYCPPRSRLRKQGWERDTGQSLRTRAPRHAEEH